MNGVFFDAEDKFGIHIAVKRYRTHTKFLFVAIKICYIRSGAGNW